MTRGFVLKVKHKQNTALTENKAMTEPHVKQEFPHRLVSILLLGLKTENHYLLQILALTGDPDTRLYQG